MEVSVSLSKHYNPGEAEPNLQALWEIAGVYHYTSNDERAVCSIDIPPATVSGVSIEVWLLISGIMV